MSTNKHEFWHFTFHNNPEVYGPIDVGKPVTKAHMLRYIAKKYETSLPIDAWHTVPWWKE